ncbi:hypothetical protein [Methylomonas koyamae]|uniref:hypothetical protein n=1 Tax=Methylomonas koyamae TaxID=702114 RepID=UPI0007C918F6|nr:hypothetical protein [Methylomonas koyamae]
MKDHFGCLRRVCLAGLLAFSSAQAHASYQVLNVAGTAGPWVWEVGGLNDAYRYGVGADGSDAIPDYTAPARLKLSDIGVGAGDALHIFFLGGLTSAFGDIPDVNNNGYVGSVFKDDELGSSGQVFPSYYYESEWGKTQNPSDPAPYGLFLQALLGALTDDNGGIIELLTLGTVVYTGEGQGFLVGSSFGIPDGATHIQFGFNDDIFGDNTGALNVCVSSEDNQCAPPVPLPGAVWFFASGIAGFLAYQRKRNA